jgi:IS30 family transposase
MSIIPLDLRSSRRQIKPDEVLKLYQENLSLEEICEKLNRKPKWVRKSLSTFGVRFGTGGARFQPTDIPFGWREIKGKLARAEDEQWILEKIEMDLREKKSPDDICKALNGLKITPRAGRKWIPEMVKRVISQNKKLKSILTSS